MKLNAMVHATWLFWWYVLTMNIFSSGTFTPCQTLFMKSFWPQRSMRSFWPQRSHSLFSPIEPTSAMWGPWMSVISAVSSHPVIGLTPYAASMATGKYNIVKGTLWRCGTLYVPEEPSLTFTKRQFNVTVINAWIRMTPLQQCRHPMQIYIYWGFLNVMITNLYQNCCGAMLSSLLFYKIVLNFIHRALQKQLCLLTKCCTLRKK